MIKLFLSSLKNALRGFLLVFKSENSFRIQVFIGLAVSLLAIFLPLEPWQKILLFLMVASVLVLEILNTIFERLADILKPRLHPLVKEIKDMMATAVLLVSLTAVLVAFYIFGEFFNWL